MYAFSFCVTAKKKKRDKSLEKKVGIRLKIQGFICILAAGSTRRHVTALPLRFSPGGNVPVQTLTYGGRVKRSGYVFETPIKLHYSQTQYGSRHPENTFETPIKLHYSQTRLKQLTGLAAFETPIKLHYSQTGGIEQHHQRAFETPIKLHYSQTVQR